MVEVLTLETGEVLTMFTTVCEVPERYLIKNTPFEVYRDTFYILRCPLHDPSVQRICRFPPRMISMSLPTCKIPTLSLNLLFFSSTRLQFRSQRTRRSVRLVLQALARGPLRSTQRTSSRGRRCWQVGVQVQSIFESEVKHVKKKLNDRNRAGDEGQEDKLIHKNHNWVVEN